MLTAVTKYVVELEEELDEEEDEEEDEVTHAMVCDYVCVREFCQYMGA